MVVCMIGKGEGNIVISAQKNNTSLYLVLLLTAFSLGCSGRRMLVTSNKYFEDPDVIALARAAEENDVKAIDRLVAKGVDINATGKENLTPLRFAFRKQHKEAFLAMLKYGANPNIIDSLSGECVTSQAALIEDDSDWLNLTLEHGGNPNVVVNPKKRLGSGYTPIFYAIEARNLESVELLIEAGADLNHQDGQGYTPLISAAAFRRYRSVYLLLKAGADWKIQSKFGHDLTDSCMMRALKNNKEHPEDYEAYRKVLAFLVEKGVDLDTSRAKLTKLGHKLQ